MTSGGRDPAKKNRLERLEDWRIFDFFSKTMADIRHFVFFAHAECALKMPMQAECAQKNCRNRE
jgi:hypothetical protein